MKLQLFRFLLLLFPLSIAGQGFVLPHPLAPTSYSDSLQFENSLKDLNLSGTTYNLIDSARKFRHIASGNDTTIWFSCNFYNSQNLTKSVYLRLCSMADSIAIFVFEDDRLSNILQGGRWMKPSQKYVPSPIPYLPLHIEPRSTKRLVVASLFSDKVTTSHYKEFSIRSVDEVNHTYINKASFQFFYAGIMVLLAIMALISSAILKNRASMYYGFLIISFIPYFLNINRLNYLILEFIPALEKLRYNFLSIALIIIFSFLFVKEYLRLKEKMPRYYQVFKGISLVALITVLLNLVDEKYLSTGNLSISVWLIVLLISAIILSYRKDRSARILLLSFGILIFGALIFTLQSISIIKPGPFTYYAFQIGSLLFSFVLFYDLASRVNIIYQDKKRIEELDQVKNRFFQDISHELRTPLTLVIDPIKKVLEKMPEGGSKMSLINARAASEDLLKLVNEILELSKLESYSEQVNLVPVDIIPLLNVVKDSFHSSALDKGVEIKFNTAIERLHLNLDQDKTYKIFNNLVSNALKFTLPGDKIEISLAVENASVAIKVRDTGQGIASQALPYIFNRYYQAPRTTEHYQIGTGIGLALVKELVQIQNGQIDVSSTPGKGSVFTVWFRTPADNISSNAQSEIIDTPKKSYEKNSGNQLLNQPEQPATPEVNTELPIAQKPLVLVIEDHPELRNYITQQLMDSYRVKEAKDGEEGIELALDQMPDLIISDLMMPGKNGYEVTARLKSEPATSHIPIILLTAKASQGDKNKGLQEGADDYLLKPFDSDELRIRINNLIRQRRELREKFLAKDDLSETDQTALSKLDRDLISRLQKVLKEEYGNPLFGVEMLAEKLSLSKAHLNRKLNALFGQSANVIIRNYRLKQAKQMIDKKEGNVSEIATACGFNSTAYFVKNFKEKHGFTPGSLL